MKIDPEKYRSSSQGPVTYEEAMSRGRPLNVDDLREIDAVIDRVTRTYGWAATRRRTTLWTPSASEQPEAVGKAPRDSAYPTTRTGPKGASRDRLAGRGTPAGCTGGTAPGAGRVEQLLSYPEHYRPHSGTEMEAVSGRARAPPYVRWVARERG